LGNSAVTKSTSGTIINLKSLNTISIGPEEESYTGIYSGTTKVTTSTSKKDAAIQETSGWGWEAAHSSLLGLRGYPSDGFTTPMDVHSNTNIMALGNYYDSSSNPNTSEFEIIADSSGMGGTGKRNVMADSSIIFRDLNISQGSYISNAYIKLKPIHTEGPTSFNVNVDLNPDPQPFNRVYPASTPNSTQPDIVTHPSAQEWPRAVSGTDPWYDTEPYNSNFNKVTNRAQRWDAQDPPAEVSEESNPFYFGVSTNIPHTWDGSTTNKYVDITQCLQELVNLAGWDLSSSCKVNLLHDDTNLVNWQDGAVNNTTTSYRTTIAGPLHPTIGWEPELTIVYI
jgi:hypothetical protein